MTVLTVNNLTNVARQVSINAIIAVGMTCAILTGDRSFGWASHGVVRVYCCRADAGRYSYSVSHDGRSVSRCLIWPGEWELYCLSADAAYHRDAGLYGDRPWFGVVVHRGYPISGLPDMFSFFGRGTVLGIQVPILIMAGVYLFAWIMLNHLSFGRYIYAIGGNEEAARLSGIRVSRYKMLVYVVSGLTAALAGLVLTSRLMVGNLMRAKV